MGSWIDYLSTDAVTDAVTETCVERACVLPMRCTKKGSGVAVSCRATGLESADDPVSARLADDPVSADDPVYPHHSQTTLYPHDSQTTLYPHDP